LRREPHPGRRRPLRRAFRPDPAADIDDELAFHLEMRAAELEARGLPPAAAREQALARFGNLTTARAECLHIARKKERRMARSEYLVDFLQDLRFGVRSLRRRPGFALVAILTLALGIGANSAVFTVLDAVLLQPLPYRDAERLVRVYHTNPAEAIDDGKFSPPDFDDIEPVAAHFEALGTFLAGVGQIGVNLQGETTPARLDAAYVSEGFFSTLGVGARAGRTFQPVDLVPGQDRSVILSSRLWEGRFGSDPEVVGRVVGIDGEPHTVLGIMPSRFAFPAPEVDVWLPLSRIGEDDIPRLRGLRWLEVVGKLRPGVEVAAARAQLDAVLGRLATAHPETNEGWTEARLEPLLDSMVGEVRPALLMLGGAVAIVLLIACANLANLLLARGSNRLRELAIRSALGAERRRLVRQLFTESAVLAGLGGIAGLALGLGGLRVLRGLALEQLPRAHDLSLDLRVVAFTFAAALASALMFGLAPALRSSGAASAAAVRSGSKGASERLGGVRAGLVVAETALAVILLVGAGLLLRSLWALTETDPGFRSENVLTARLSFHGEQPPAVRAQRQARILARLAEVPGAVAVGASKTLPLHGGGEPYGFSLPARPDEEIRPAAGGLIVSPGYFRALDIPVLAGREYTLGDTEPDAAYGILVNRTLARQLWPEGEAVGQTVRFLGTEMSVFGVVGDVRVRGLAAAPEPALYISSHLTVRSAMSVFVRTAGDPAALAPAVRAAIAEVEPELPIAELAPLTELVSRTVVQPRFFATLLAIFSTVALALALVGLYGVLSFAVAQRTREIGIRLALGAERSRVVGMILGRTARLTGLGIAIGIAGALAAGRLIAGQLHGVAASDPPTLAAVAAVIGAGALLAAWVPARRAAAVEPAASMRE
jgi:predicted permease